MTRPGHDNVVTLFDSNFRDAPATLRKIAERIEEGRYGDVGCAAIVLMGDTTEVFGCGADAELADIMLLLNAGALRLTRIIEEHGK